MHVMPYYSTTAVDTMIFSNADNGNMCITPSTSCSVTQICPELELLLINIMVGRSKQYYCRTVNEVPFLITVVVIVTRI
jgi:hypothetical protein